MKVKKKYIEGYGKEIQWKDCEYVLSIQGGMCNGGTVVQKLL